MTTTTEHPTVAVGDFFVSSWGYDQTNIDYYKVIEVTASGKSVKVQQWQSKVANANEYSDTVIPGDGPLTWPRWVDGQCVGEQPAGVMTKRLRPSYDGRPGLTLTSYSTARLWDGAAKYQTAIGCGH